MKENKIEMIELRKQGLTYKAIGEKFGISKQRVCWLIGNERVRKGTVDLDRIKYKGIHQMFVNDPKMTWHKLARVMFGYTDRSAVNRATLFATGKFETLSLTAINKLREYTGMTYEELFEERYNDQIQKP